MHATLIEGNDHRPLIRFEDGRTAVPINLRFLSRADFLTCVGRRVIIRSQLSEQHFTVQLPGHAEQP